MKYWCDNSPIWSHYNNASSVLFPAWEKAFASVIKAYLPQVKDAELKARMLEFIKEELSHANAHEAFNERHDLKELEEAQFKNAKVVYKKPKLKLWLGAMVSIEHLASCMSRLILGRWGHKSGKDYKLFCWHAKEELGHKSLAIDLWNYLGYSSKDLRKAAWNNQKYVMGFLIWHTLKMTFNDNKFKQLSTWKDLVVWSWLITSKMLLPMLAIYLPKFHPEKINDERYLRVAI